MEMKNEYKIILALSGLVMAYLILSKAGNMFSNMFATIGIGSSAEDDKREKEIIQTENKIKDIFNPNFYKNFPKNKPKSKIKTMAFNNAKALQIKKAIGLIYDTPEAIVSAFKGFQYQTEVSFFAKVWADKYGTDLYEYLNDKLDTDKQRTSFLKILSYVKNLPIGFYK
jgi:hypothetical protein